MEKQLILIIGAGLAGPALALSLARHSIKSTIFEIRPSLSEPGGSITLAANAVRALTLLGGDELIARIQAAGFVYTRMTAFLSTGYRYGDLVVGEEGEGGVPAVRIMRTALNKLLLEECEKKGVDVRWGKKLESIREDDGGVTAVFEDGSIKQGESWKDLSSPQAQRSLARTVSTPSLANTSCLNPQSPLTPAPASSTASSPARPSLHPHPIIPSLL